MNAPATVPTKGGMYVRKGETCRKALVRVDECADGHVSYYPDSGGSVAQCGLEEFNEHFESVSRETVTGWSGRYDKARFRGEWFPEDADDIEGYMDGDDWNGWQVPYITRGTLLDAIEKGLIGDPIFGSSLAIFDDVRDTLVRVSSQSGDRLPAGPDRNAILAAVDAGNEEIMFGDHECRVEASVGSDIVVDGETVHIYNVGFGLVWDLTVT